MREIETRHLGNPQDLQGPKTRVGESENNGVEIKPGFSYYYHQNDPGKSGTSEIWWAPFTKTFPMIRSRLIVSWLIDGNWELVG